jgi:hypothetical protein
MRVLKARGGIIGAEGTMLSSTLKYMHMEGTAAPYRNPKPGASKKKQPPVDDGRDGWV